MLVLFTDTNTDINPETAAEYGYRLISMPYSIENETFYPYEDYETFDPHPFYEKLRSGILPSTFAITADRYMNYFRPVFEEGNDILYVHFSKSASGTFEAMEQAVEILKKEFANRKFYEIDTKGVSAVSLNILKEIGDLYLAGATVDELLEWAKAEVNKFAIYFFVDDLTFLKRSGRVSNIAGTMGTLLGIRPIIHVNEEGNMVSIGKEKGRRNAVDRLIRYVEEIGDNATQHRFIITHTDAPELAEELKELLKQRIGENIRLEITNVSPTIGCHCGPDSVALSFHVKHR